MLSFVAGRLGKAVTVMLIVSLAVASLLSLIRGSAAEAILGTSATPEAVAALNTELGMDDPLLVRWWHWLTGAVTGDLGTSPLTGQPIWEAIADRLPVTLTLAAFALVLALAIAIPLAIVSALTAGRWPDRVITAVASVLLSVPSFVVAPLLILVFALKLDVLPASGWVPFTEDPLACLEFLLLPAVAIACTEVAAFHRILRSDLVTTLGEEFVQAARAKGLGSATVVLRHALRPSSFSLITVVGLNLGRLIGGTVIVETLFSLPGLGLLITSSISSRDIVMVQGVVVFMALVYVLINTLVDVGYTIVDPRTRSVTR